MDIVGIKLENFRSYKSTDWIPLENRLTIVGENNAGKSNFLDAVNYFFKFGTRKPHTKSDFHLENINMPITISVKFRNFSEDEFETFSNYIFDESLIVKMELPFDKETNSIETKSYFVQREIIADEDLQDIGDKDPNEAIDIYYKHEDELKPFKTEERWKQESRASIERVVDAYIESGEGKTRKEWISPTGISDDLKDSLPSLTFYRAERGLDQATRTSNKSSLLYQLLDSALEEVPTEEREEISSKLENLEEQLNSADIFGPIRELEKALSEKLSSQINHMGRINIETTVPKLDEIVRRQATVKVEGEYSSKMEDMGSGSKMSFLLASLWETVERETDQMMLALEEPENDLHPHSQRQLLNTLSKLAEKGHYVFLTTHSPELVDLSSSTNIRRVEKRSSESHIHTFEEGLTDQEEEKLETVATSENNEMFFSRGVLVCEGATERTVIPILNSILRKQREDIDSFDARGVSIIEAGGKQNIPLYLKIVNQFEIPSIALMDDDQSDIEGETQEVDEELLDDIEALSDEFVLLEGDIEQALFESVSVGEYCEAMTSLEELEVVPEFEDDVEGLNRAIESDPNKNKSDTLRWSFSRHKPPKPAFGRQLVKEVNDNRIPSDLEDAIQVALKISE